MDAEKAIKNLKLRGFKVSRFDTGAQAAGYLAGELKGKTVGIGGSKTVDQIGLYDLLDPSSTYWHWKVPGDETCRKANAAQVYVSGANGLSENGEIVNIDGRGNRVAGTLYGHEKVFIVTSLSKLQPDLHTAIDRARNVAAVQNVRRFPNQTPCKVDGKCHDCWGTNSLCNALVVLWGPMLGMETEVVLIDEELGM